jgi:hypothetical protein
MDQRRPRCERREYQRRHQHAAQSGGYHWNGLASALQFAHQQFALDFHAEHEKKKAHHAFVDPVVQTHGQRPVTEDQPGPGQQQRFIAVIERGIRHQERGERADDEQDTARHLIMGEPLEGRHDFLELPLERCSHVFPLTVFVFVWLEAENYRMETSWPTRCRTGTDGRDMIPGAHCCDDM